jgi:hypothetical protein
MLKGNINWFSSDLKFKESENIVAIDGVISDVLLDDFSIKFNVQTEQFKYNIKMLADDIGIGYTGEIICKNDICGEVKCEILTNEKSIILFGSWIEDEEYYT